MVKEKQNVDFVEKAYEVPTPPEGGDHPEQDWTPEEEKAVVYVSTFLCALYLLSVLQEEGRLACLSYAVLRLRIVAT